MNLLIHQIPPRHRSTPSRVLLAFLAAFGLVAGASAVPATAAPAPPINYVNLGDSYSAGWGAGAPNVNNYLPGCSVSGPDHVTLLAALTSLHLVGDFACAGATAAPGANFPVPAVPPSVPDQILAAATSGKLNAQTGLVTLTAGGNDLGFEGILTQCGALKQSGQSCLGLFTQGAANAGSITPIVTAVATSIAQAAPNARIAWLGYPRLFAVAGEPTTVQPGDGFLTNDEAVALDAAIDALNSAIAAGLPRGSNTQFVDVATKFIGHELGSSDPWITPLVLVPGAPGYDVNLHPTATGYAEGYFPAVVSQVKPAQLANAQKKS